MIPVNGNLGGQMSQRTCAYCGKTRSDGCRCKYKPKGKRVDGKNHGWYIEVSNISQQTNLDEMIESIKTALPASSKDPKKAVGCWKWSFSLVEEK